MEVRATAKGFYDLRLRHEGDVFTIKSDKDFSSIWMEKVDGKAKAKAPKPSPKEVHHEALEKAIDRRAIDPEDVI